MVATRCTQKVFDISIVKAQLRQNALELLLQEVITNTPGPQVLGTLNHNLAGKLPSVRCFNAFGHEILLDLIRPKLHESLRLGLVLLPFDLLPLLGLDGIPSQLLQERHDGQGQMLGHLLVAKCSAKKGMIFCGDMDWQNRKQIINLQKYCKTSGFTNNRQITSKFEWYPDSIHM